MEQEYVDRGNTFGNHSGPAGTYNAGNRGKLTEAQTEERLRFHAVSLTTGSPTIKAIVQYWIEKYGISISLQTEKEFRKHNKDRIEKKRMEMIEAGEIAIPVISEQVLNNSMLELTLSTSRLSAKIREKADKIVSGLEVGNIGEDEKEDKKTKAKISILDSLCSNLTMLNKNITDQIESMFEFAGKIKIKDKKVEKLVQEEVDKQISGIQEAEVVGEDTPLDEMRAKFLTQKDG